MAELEIEYLGFKIVDWLVLRTPTVVKVTADIMLFSH